jgi:hypothetical protein
MSVRFRCKLKCQPVLAESVLHCRAAARVTDRGVVENPSPRDHSAGRSARSPILLKRAVALARVDVRPSARVCNCRCDGPSRVDFLRDVQLAEDLTVLNNVVAPWVADSNATVVRAGAADVFRAAATLYPKVWRTPGGEVERSRSVSRAGHVVVKSSKAGSDIYDRPRIVGNKETNG